jgi:hypothetical protein
MCKLSILPTGSTTSFSVSSKRRLSPADILLAAIDSIQSKLSPWLEVRYATEIGRWKATPTEAGEREFGGNGSIEIYTRSQYRANNDLL